MKLDRTHWTHTGDVLTHPPGTTRLNPAYTYLRTVWAESHNDRATTLLKKPIYGVMREYEVYQEGMMLNLWVSAHPFYLVRGST